MVGNKAQKAVAAALTGMMVLGSAAPAFAEPNWKRVAGDTRYGTMYEAVVGNANDDGVSMWGTQVWNPSYYEVSTGGKTVALLKFEKTAGDKLVKAGVLSKIIDGNGSTVYFLKDVKVNCAAESFADYQSAWDDLLAAQVGAVDNKKLDTPVDVTDPDKGYITQPGYAVVSSIVLASGDKYADALTGSSLAGSYNAPIVTTKSDALSAEAKDLIKMYFDQLVEQNKANLTIRVEFDEDGNLIRRVSVPVKLDVYVVGGTSAVAKEALDYVNSLSEKIDDDTTVYAKAVRIAGDDRVATSLAVAQAEFDYFIGGKDPDSWRDFWNTDEIIITNGYAWADAVSVSAYAYENSTPILYTQADGTLTDEEIAFLQQVNEDPRGNSQLRVMVVGGPAEASADQLNGLGFKRSRIEVIKGDDRYDTSAEFIKVTDVVRTGIVEVGPMQLPVGGVAIATGHDFADALVGGAFIGSRGGSLALVGEPGEADYDKAAKEVIYKTRSKGNEGFIMGGTKAVSAEMEAHLEVLV